MKNSVLLAALLVAIVFSLLHSMKLIRLINTTITETARNDEQPVALTVSKNFAISNKTASQMPKNSKTMEIAIKENKQLVTSTTIENFTNSSETTSLSLREINETKNKGIKKHSDVTLTTAFFNLRDFKKGTRIRRRKEYKNWINVYKRMRFPIIFYTDDHEFYEEFMIIRKNLSELTKCHMINRTSLYSFQLISRIREIFGQSSYPKHYPNTFLPEYSCVMHAKYELVQKSIKENLFSSKYFAWIDLGGFRTVKVDGHLLDFHFPPNFTDNEIAVALISPLQKGLSTETIIKNNKVWIGGGFILGESNLLSKFIFNYRKEVDRMLSQNLMSTDQQVIYSMYSNASMSNVPLKTYNSNSKKCDQWFYLILTIIGIQC